MIVDTAEFKATLQVLEILNKDKSRYNEMFRKTKVSHTTLQKVLKELEEKDCIKRIELGSLSTEYEIKDKGKKLLSNLKNLVNLLL